MTTDAQLDPDQFGRPPLLPARYRIDVEHSTIGFTVRHVFGLGRVRGRFGLRSGLIVVADPVAGSSVQAVVASDSFTSGNPSRDAAVRGRRLLDVGRFPDLLFTGEGRVLEREGLRVSGQLRVRGVVSDVTVLVSDWQVTEEVLRLRATARVDRVAAGVRRQGWVAGRNLSLDLNIRAVAEAGQVLR